MDSSDEFVYQLRSVLAFLQDHGFSKAAEAVYESLDNQDNKPSLDIEDRQQEASPSHSAPSGYGQELADHAEGEDEYRSKSAEPVLVSRCDLRSEPAELLAANVLTIDPRCPAVQPWCLRRGR